MKNYEEFIESVEHEDKQLNKNETENLTQNKTSYTKEKNRKYIKRRIRQIQKTMNKFVNGYSSYK